MATTRLWSVGQHLRTVLDTTATLMVIAASAAVLFHVWPTRPPPPPVAPPGEKLLLPRVPKQPHPLAGAPLLGNRDARVTLVAYSDFECPFCARFATDTWPEIKKRYVDSNKILVAFRHLPVDLIRFRGHLPKGGYDVRNGRHTQPTAPSALHR